MNRDALIALLACHLGWVPRTRAEELLREDPSQSSNSQTQRVQSTLKVTSSETELLIQLADTWVARHRGDMEAGLADLRQRLGWPETVSDDTQPAKSVAGKDPAPGASSESTLPLNQVEFELAPEFSGGDQSERFVRLRAHAQGGLGLVSVARDRQLDREVAFKELLPKYADDHAVQQRFVREARLTGGLEHPGVVPVYGLGRDDLGRPYYAMRFIEGESLAAALKSLRPVAGAGTRVVPRLTLHALLQRFVDICMTMQYAHRHGIVHRDLKPANVMLGDFGETLVVDWGLAKRIGETPDGDNEQESEENDLTGSETLTREGGVAGTPAYMSPEQAAGGFKQLAAASDIFSLGAILYHLLTGQAPYPRGTATERVQLAAHCQFQRPSAVASGIPRALEAICLRAMATEPSDRYDSAASLAADVQRWMADEPVEAHRETLVDRGGRWLRKNRAWALSATTALLLISIVSIAAALVVNGRNQEIARQNQEIASQKTVAEQLAQKEAQARQEAERRREEADDERFQAEAITNFLVDSFELANPALDGRDVTVAQVLDSIVAVVSKDTEVKPRIRSTLLHAAGKSYLGLGLPFEAEPILRSAYDLAEQHFGNDHVRTIICGSSLGIALVDTGHLEEATPLIEQTLRDARATLTDRDPSDLAEVLIHAAEVLYRTDDNQRALALGLEGEELFTRVMGLNHDDTLRASTMVAAVLSKLGRFDEAYERLKRVHAQRSQRLGPDHPKVAGTVNNLAEVLARLRRYDEAIPYIEQAVKSSEQWFEPGHSRLLTMRANLGALYGEVDRYQDAADLLEELLPEVQDHLGTEHPLTLTVMNSLGHAYTNLGDAKGGEQILQQVYELRKTHLGSDHSQTATALNNLALAIYDQGDLARALPLFEEVYSTRKQTLGPSHPRTYDSAAHVAWTLQQLGMPEKALPVLREWLSAAQSAQDKDAVLRAALELGKGWNRAANYEQAEKMFAAIVASDRADGKVEWDAPLMQLELGIAQLGLQQIEAATQTLTDAREAFNSLSQKDYPHDSAGLRLAVEQAIQLADQEGLTEVYESWGQLLSEQN